MDKDIIKLKTKRMIISPMSDDEIEWLMNDTDEEHMKKAYGEMLQGCLDYPDDRVWFAPWKMVLSEKDNYENANKDSSGESDAGERDDEKTIGDLCFKGPAKIGSLEIGYGIHPEFEGQGLMTEAAEALIKWAFSQPKVFRVIAETEPDNNASQRILEKLGFKPMGINGEEGPLFYKKNPKPDYEKLDEIFDVRTCTEEDAKEICTWKYEGDYSIYNFASWEKVCENDWDLADPDRRKKSWVSVLCEGKLFGFYNVMFRGNHIELGIGMHPKWCGLHFYGELFMRRAIFLIQEIYGNLPIVLKVRPFNKRAIKCYENCGFRIVSKYYEETFIVPGEMYNMVLGETDSFDFLV